jgi:hypothetical protein
MEKPTKKKSRRKSIKPSTLKSNMLFNAVYIVKGFTDVVSRAVVAPDMETAIGLVKNTFNVLRFTSITEVNSNVWV